MMPREDVKIVFVQCASCWGQRRIYVKAGDGTYHGYPCATCLGVGEVFNIDVSMEGPHE